jgi:light-regulated signal transduction histidine kinase (bacteriophytochrome)
VRTLAQLPPFELGTTGTAEPAAGRGARAGITGARWIYVAGLLLAPLLGWFELAGERRGWFPREWGVASLGVAGLLLFTALFLGHARSLASREREHERELAAASARDGGERSLAERRIERCEAELERSRRELQEFASAAAHDLREPLRKIVSFGERLRERAGPSLDPSALDCVRRMEAAAQRMEGMLEGLLELSRVETRAQPGAPTRLSEVVAEVRRELGATLRECGGEVEVGPLPVISADPAQMRSLFRHLLGNAVKFRSPERPLRIRVRAEPAAERGWRLVVEDNGLGFDEGSRERLFKPFQRLHGRGEFDGAGMGLAICRKIAHRHRGGIEAASRPGAGSRFVVTLPSEPDSADPPAQAG